MKEFKLTESYCLAKIKKHHSKIIVEKTIKDLKKQRDTLMSGDDSKLKNFWEEYAVQLQDEESFYFDNYVDTVRNLIETKISEQPEVIQNLIDFSENENFDEDNEFENHQFSYDREFSINTILEDLDSAAINFENKRVRKYIERNY